MAKDPVSPQGTATLSQLRCRPVPACCPLTLSLYPSMLTLLTWLCADPDVVSLEAADRPNFFLHVTANGSVELAKWQGSEAFHHHASFLLHQGTWRVGLVALESLAKPSFFLYVSGLGLALRLYEHTEAFRWGTLFHLWGRCPPCHHPWALALGPHSYPLPTTPLQWP